MFTKYATLEETEVLDVKGTQNRLYVASLDKVSDYDNYRVGDGYMYVRLRAISSRVNKNHDGWPSVELAGGSDIFNHYSKQASGGFTIEAAQGNKEFGFATFMGKPNFIDHNNANPSRARGAVVDAKLRVLPVQHIAASGDDYWLGPNVDPEHLPPTEIELLIEVDANRFPKYAQYLRNGDIDGFSMGCDVESSKCSHCGHVATNPSEYCSHIVMKGAHHDFKTAEGKRVSRKSYENCYGIKFFEISAVFEPADETALAREIRANVHKEGVLENELGYDMEPDPLRHHNENEIEQHAQYLMQKYPGEFTWPKALELATEKVGDIGKFVPGEGEAPPVKQGDYMPLPAKFPPPVRPELEGAGVNAPFQNAAEEAMNKAYPRRPVPNDPYLSSVQKTAENPLPQSMHTTAPEEVDTLRDERNCPQCGNTMEGEQCDVCGYVEPPKGMDNPDLGKAQELKQRMREQDEAILQNPGGSPENQGNQGAPQGPGTQLPPQAQQQGGGSFMQNRQQARNPIATASVMSDMRWSPVIDPKIAGRINKQEKAVKPATKPATNEPAVTQVTKNPQKPVTSAMRTAQELIADANKGDTMSNTKTADGPTPPSTSEGTGADVRVDATGVGGVLDASNEQASKGGDNKGKPGEYAQVDVTDIGTTGNPDVSADKTDSLGAAAEGSDDSGFNKDKNIEAIPTKTYDDADGTQKGLTDEVTRQSLEGIQNDGSGGFSAGDSPVGGSGGGDSRPYSSSARKAYDAKPFYDQPGLSGGSANKGTQPTDPVGTRGDEGRYERVDVLSPTATPDNNSGPTSTWSGTDGNKIYRQQDPVTTEVSEQYHDGWTSHLTSALKLANTEVDLGLVDRDRQPARFAELIEQGERELQAQIDTLDRVKTAGVKKLEQKRQAGVTRMPSMFGQHTAAGRVQLEGEEPQVQITEDVGDSALFSR